MRECDLIMKGGITSGVVYPHAIAEIAGAYRLRNVGGTSAGAIGAVMAAAAEFRRQNPADLGSKVGFDQISNMAEELGRDMRSLFQPSPRLRPLFDILMGMIEKPNGKSGAVVLLMTALKAYSGRAIIGAGTGLIVATSGTIVGEVWLILFGLFFGLVAMTLLVALALMKMVFKDLPNHDFGICPGLKVDGDSGDGFTDWIADQIDLVGANLNDDGTLAKPLTVGQLQDRGIEVATMTTDLSSRRPYQLPLKSRHHLFSEREMKKVLPTRVVEYMVNAGERFQHSNPNVPGDLHWLPIDRDFPVLLVARMSLSFPGLIRAVPLYRFDDQLKTDGDSTMKIRRCLFSDGGISSNFPIHFFDALLPRRPTFGITLTSWEEVRHGDVRVYLPKGGRQSTDVPIRPVNGILGFIDSIVNTAKDWQDSMQSLMPGYAERIVEVRLDDSREGGLNLDMPTEVIRDLAEYGRRAGQALVRDFEMNEHRYLRAISLLKTAEEDMEKLAVSYAAAPDGAEQDSLTYAQIFSDYVPTAFPNSKTWRREVLGGLAKLLAKLGDKAQTNHSSPGRKSVRKGLLPSFDAGLRLIASADRVPEHPKSVNAGNDGGDGGLYAKE